MELNQRLLVFGDLNSEVELVEQRLSMAGQILASMYVHSSGAFIDSVGRFRPDLIVFDCTQPDLEAETALRLSQARPKDVPFLIISRDGDEHTITECIEAGACDCITKEPAARFRAVVISALERCRLLKEKEHAEGALKSSVLLNRDLFEASPIPFWREDFSGVSSNIDALHQRGIHDFRSYFDQHPEGVRECASLVQILEINGATVEFFGAKNREELRAHLAAVYCEETWEVFKEQLIAIGEGRKILEMNATYADLSGRRIQGRLRWLVTAGHERSYSQVILSLLDTTRYGQVEGIRGTCEDITESKRVKEALRASEEKYRKFFEEDLSGDYIATPEGKILACNPTFAQIFGFESVEEALSTNAGILFPSTQAREEFLNKLRDQKMLARHEAELRRKDGKPVYVVENAVGIFGEAGELREIRGYIFDDTDRKKLEDQLRQSQKMEAIGRLAGGVAHDFNNLLTCITGYCDLLLSEIEASNPMRKDVEEIRDAGERASVLVRQLLAFSRRQVLLPRPLDLDLVIAGLEKLVRRLIGEDINLRILRNGTLSRVKADPGQIEQVIMNLVVNSRDAMPNGGDLVIETTNVHLDPDHSGRNDSGKSGPHVMISVRDTGCGMSDEVKSHLFEPFFTTKEGGKGTGLGLSTLYGIVKQSGGSIALESEVGRGTTFKIFLPHAEGDHEYPAAHHRSGGLPRGFETVLVVEDDEAVRAFSVKTLRLLGYSVLQARNGEEAMRLCTSHQEAIHLLLTDVVMPGMSGRELGRRILEARPDTRILFVSGYYEKAGSGPSESGPDETLLAKPFTPQSLGSAVRNVLDRI